MAVSPLKDTKTYKEQVELLKSRGLIINSPRKAQKFLSTVSYYSFSGYCLPFYSAPDVFRSGVSFETIQDTYLFDSELREFLYPIICEIEIRLRTQTAYYWGLNKEKELTLTYLSFPAEKDSKNLCLPLEQK